MVTIETLRAARDSTQRLSTHQLGYLAAEARRELSTDVLGAELKDEPEALEDRQRQLRAVTSAYTRRKGELDFGIKIVEGTNWVVLTALTGGTGRMLPGGMGGRGVLNGVKTVATLGLGKVEAMMKESARQELRRNLRHSLDKYREEQPALVPSLLATKNSKAFRAELEARVGPVFGSALDELPAEDQDIVNRFYMQEVATVLSDRLDSLDKVQVLQGEEIEQNRQNIAGLARTFVQFAERTNEQLTALVETTVELQGTVGQLEDRVGGVEEGVAFLQRFAFGRMTPEEQLLAAREGQIELSPEERLQVEAAVARKKLNDTMSDFIGGANNVVQIARGLGVSEDILGPAQEAVQIANQAATAIQEFAGGNVLGGLAAVAGIFGAGGPDIAQERHTQMMNAIQSLYEQVGMVSEKLDELQKGQKRILEGQELMMRAIGFLADDLSRNQTETMKALGRIEESVLYNRMLILDRIDEEYRFAERFMIEPITNHVVLDTATGLYPSEAELRQIIQVMKKQFDKAESRLQDVWGFKNRFQSVFLLESYYTENLTDEQLIKIGQDESIRMFGKELYQGQFDLMISIAPAGADARSTILSSLLAPVMTTAAVRQKSTIPRNVWTAERYENTFENLIRDPLSPAAVEAHARLVLDFQVLYHLYDTDAERVYTTDDLAKGVEINIKGLVALLHALAILDIAVAQQAMLGGDILLTSAEAIIEAVPRGADISPANVEPEVVRFRALLEVMDRNPMFARNVLRYRVLKDITQNKGSTLTMYAIAWEDPNGEDLLRLALSDPWSLRWSEEEPRGWVINLGKSVAALPSVQELVDGRLLYPIALDTLVALRDRVIDEIVDFYVSGSLPNAVRHGFNRAILATCMGAAVQAA